MPHTIEYRTVSDSRAFHPKTWGKSHREYRVVWDMYTPLRPDELKDFIRDNGNARGECEWQTLEEQ